MRHYLLWNVLFFSVLSNLLSCRKRIKKTGILCAGRTNPAKKYVSVSHTTPHLALGSLSAPHYSPSSRHAVSIASPSPHHVAHPDDASPLPRPHPLPLPPPEVPASFRSTLIFSGRRSPADSTVHRAHLHLPHLLSRTT